MSNYEAYKPSTGAMGDRLTAMKAAFQVGLITQSASSTSGGKALSYKHKLGELGFGFVFFSL